MLTYAASGGAGRDAYSLFALNDGSSVLTAAVAAADQTLNIASASLAGITNVRMCQHMSAYGLTRTHGKTTSSHADVC